MIVEVKWSSGRSDRRWSTQLYASSVAFSATFHGERGQGGGGSSGRHRLKINVVQEGWYTDTIETFPASPPFSEDNEWMNEWMSDRKKTNAIYICFRRERHTRMNARPPKWKVVSDTPISIRWIASLISARFDARPLLHSHVAPKHSSNLWWIRPVSLHSFFFNFSRNLKATTTRTKKYKSISCKSLSFANNTRHLFELVEFTGKPNRPD